MNFLPYYISLFAEDERMHDLFRSLRAIRAKEGMNDAVMGLLVLAGIITVMLIVSIIIDVKHRTRGYFSPKGLFWSLCRAHQLKLSERWLLWRLARLDNMTDPARLFLEPEWYASSNLPAALSQYGQQLKIIRNRLFGELKQKNIIKESIPFDLELPVTPQGVALPSVGNHPNLDIPPWSNTGYTPPLPPLTNSSDSTPV